MAKGKMPAAFARFAAAKKKSSPKSGVAPGMKQKAIASHLKKASRKG